MSITQELQYVKSTKRAHVFANGTFTAFYIPKEIVQKICEAKSEEAPNFVTLTLSVKGASHV